MKSSVLIAKKYGQPDVLEVVTTDLPKLAVGMARIQVKASGINPIDARRMTGEFKHSGLPQTFGTEFAGVIVEIDSNNSGWNIGDEVLGSGGAFTHASVIDVPIVNLVRRPANMNWEVAGTIAGVGQTAMTILDEIGNIDSLLIHGASGGVGSITIQLAKERGIKVVATASEKNQQYLRDLGAIPVTYGSGLLQRIQTVHQDLFDASIDMIGNEEATQASLQAVKSNGFIGTIAGRPVSSNRVRPVWVKRNVGNLQHVVDGIAAGRFKWEVSATYPFENAKQAYSDILDGHTRGKSALTF
nr:NADP-dependent oxidoreductase [Acinetobacter sp. Marseille-Q1620]